MSINEIKDFKIIEECQIIKMNTEENLSNTNLHNISNILNENKETLDEYINTNHFDLLTEEPIRGTDLNLPRETMCVPPVSIKIEYDDIIDDCWTNISK
jgi:hypothetical protein